MSVFVPANNAVLYMSDSTPITISEESVRRESEELAAMARELSARQARFTKLLDFLQAMGKEEWIPAGASQAATLPLLGRTPGMPGTWASEMLKAMEAFPEGVALVDLLEAMKSGPLAARVRQNRNGVYNAATKLEQTGQIVKHNGRVFLPAHYEEYRKRVERGEIAEVKRERKGLRTAADALVDFISTHPEGVEAGDIVAGMKAQGMSPGTVYNNLSKIAMKDRVRREGKLYLPLNSEAPAGEPESASKITDDEVPASPSNMGSGND